MSNPINESIDIPPIIAHRRRGYYTPSLGHSYSNNTPLIIPDKSAAKNSGVCESPKYIPSFPFYTIDTV